MTELCTADMNALLRRRYQHHAGNGDRYAIAQEVRNAAGFGASRSCDFMAMDLWPSHGLQIIGHEVKVSRSDWLRELKDPTKAEAFKRYCDRWWLVVSDPGIVKPSELPAGWGLMTVVGSRGLVVAQHAPVLHPEPMPRTMWACWLRAVRMTANFAFTEQTNSNTHAFIKLQQENWRLARELRDLQVRYPPISPMDSADCLL